MIITDASAAGNIGNFLNVQIVHLNGDASYTLMVEVGEIMVKYSAPDGTSDFMGTMKALSNTIMVPHILLPVFTTHPGW